MLRNVLADYLNNINERELDVPFVGLLASTGFYDIHFTHGQAEFGKDFIAKRVEGGVVLQYSFQSKAGDINQATWRNDILGQMLESVLTGLSHPNFDRSLPHQSVLVTTGRLVGNAPIDFQDFNSNTLAATYRKRPIVLWDQETLIDYFGTHGLDCMYRATSIGFQSYGNFYRLYSASLQAIVSEHDIERHSRHWLDDSANNGQRLLGTALEAEIIAQKCVSNGLTYEAIHAHLSTLRAVLYALYDAGDASEVQGLCEIYVQAMEKLRQCCRTYSSEIMQKWTDRGKDLVRLLDGVDPMMTYLVLCARVIEVLGCLYFIEDTQEARNDIAASIRDFMRHEPGCGHIPSDRYAVSLIPPVIALMDSSCPEDAQELVRRATIWLCDRYDEGAGLAFVEADPYGEVATLFGYPFDFIPVHSTRASLLASIISDLAAFVGNKQFYSDVVNDIKACTIFPTYWQAMDTKGLFLIEGADVIGYPNIEYADTIADFTDYNWADHIRNEPRLFRFVQMVGAFGAMALTLLLRDRYFPTVWPSLLQRRADLHGIS